MKSISKPKRLAIYLRDGLACVYCGEDIEGGAKLSLDPLKPYSTGGSNESSNLVTACLRCAPARGTRSVRAFCRTVAAYLNRSATAQEIERNVRNAAGRKIDLPAAKALIERRGSWAESLRK